MRITRALDESRVSSLPAMLSLCPVPCCGAVTMGGTCVVHDVPTTRVFERGRPYIAPVAVALWD